MGPPIAAARPYPFISRERDLRYHPLLAPGVRHLAVLGACLLVLIGASYWLNNWELVYSTRGVVYGASATDIHATRNSPIALRITLISCFSQTPTIACCRQMSRTLGIVAKTDSIGCGVPTRVQGFGEQYVQKYTAGKQTTLTF